MNIHHTQLVQLFLEGSHFESLEKTKSNVMAWLKGLMPEMLGCIYRPQKARIMMLTTITEDQLQFLFFVSLWN
jgi:hypothetical protein